MSKNDKNLILDYKVGDEQALVEFINRYNEKVTTFVYSKVKDRKITEELFQKTFIRFIKYVKSEKYIDDEPLPHLMRIAKNELVVWFKEPTYVASPELILEFSIDDKTPEHEMMEIIENTILMADDAFRDLGGSGLKIDSINASSKVKTLQIN